MKQIYLVRHAKSSWDLPGLPDIDRPLNDRGYGDAYLVSRFLQKQAPCPDVFISSSAIRAISTCLIFTRAFEFDPQLMKIRPGLYESDIKRYLHELRSVPANFESVILFGHNYTISEVAVFLTGLDLEEFPTCGVAGLSAEVKEWGMIDGDTCKQEFMITPKQLKTT